MLIMPSSKLNYNLNILILTSILILVNGCGSFSSTSLVSADGIYDERESETANNSSKYYENYFKEKSLELESGFIFSDTVSSESDFINSGDISYSSNQAAWGDIPDTTDYVVDYFPYRNRYFGLGFGFGYFGMYPYYGNWYPGYSYRFVRNMYRYGWMFGYGYFPSYYDFYPYGWWGNSMPFDYRNRYSSYGINNNLYNNKFNRNINSNVSYNSGKRGSSPSVVVYGDGKKTSSPVRNIKNVSGSNINYNVGRSSTLNDNNLDLENSDLKIRSYNDFVKNNPNLNNIERNRIYSRPEMGVGVVGSSSKTKTRSSDNVESRRYYNNPTNNYSGRPAKETQYNWGLGGRSNSNSVNTPYNRVRSYSNPGSNPPSSSRSFNSSSSTYSRSSSPPPAMGNSSRSSSSTSVRANGRGSR